MTASTARQITTKPDNTGNLVKHPGERDGRGARRFHAKFASRAQTWRHRAIRLSDATSQTRKLDCRYRGLLWIRRLKVRILPPQPTRCHGQTLSKYQCGQIPRFVRHANTPGYRVIRVSERALGSRSNISSTPGVRASRRVRRASTKRSQIAIRRPAQTLCSRRRQVPHMAYTRDTRRATQNGLELTSRVRSKQDRLLTSDVGAISR